MYECLWTFNAFLDTVGPASGSTRRLSGRRLGRRPHPRLRGSSRLRSPRSRLCTLRSGRLRSPRNPKPLQSHALAAGIDAATVGVRVPGSCLQKWQKRLVVNALGFAIVRPVQPFALGTGFSKWLRSKETVSGH